MSSRDKILNAVKANKPSPAPLPEQIAFGENDRELTSYFTETFVAVGGSALVISDLQEVADSLMQLFDSPERIISTIPGVNFGEYVSEPIADGHSLHTLQAAIVPAKLGVAENAAVWVDADKLPNRVLPVICEDLVLVLSAKDIVANMHEAYDRLAVEETGYGMFISGPSRTADIEQSLVIGAHGPKRAHIFIIQDSQAPAL